MSLGTYEMFYSTSADLHIFYRGYRDLKDVKGNTYDGLKLKEKVAQEKKKTGKKDQKARLEARERDNSYSMFKTAIDGMTELAKENSALRNSKRLDQNKQDHFDFFN